ncbi:unnamed protein product [Rotaria sp. Silwood1]|nr:unnamed protein product [Rotaria sp. Silwood1]CAF3471690.1 unnamed protein product [Rotaria sp. Silwood1]CAF3509763.1 unnamed protein product [Rotaria sp. Silwood1]CAF3527682.1 unnamed protein product [Rotaria sp. Silwood1]CAF4532419.1 unnamed protein product [Rotaria sp. Silwood1]
MKISSSTATLMTMSNNVTSLSISTIQQLSSSSYYTSMIKRLFIVFGSISFLWLIMGLIFASIQTFRHLKRKTHQKLFLYHRPLPPIQSQSSSSAPPPASSSLLTSMGQPLQEGNISDNDNDEDDDDDDDQASVFTSVSFISERSKSTHEHAHVVALCERIPEEEFELTFTTPVGISNMGYSPSTLTSSNDGESSLVQYPACRNFAYSQSTLASSTADLNISTASVIVPINESSSTKSLSNRFVHLKRHASQSSTTTTFSQITNATYLSSSSTSTSSSIPLTSIKTMPLPTVMITDCDRLQTDIIELDDFEPEKDWRRARPELRLLLNDRMPQAVR